MTRIKRCITISLIFAITFPYIAESLLTYSASAIDDSVLEDYAASNIMFYDPSACSGEKTGKNGGSITIHPEDLPPEAISRLESEDIKGKAEKNYSAYAAGASEIGAPWQALAALHYREAGMDPNKSMTNGAPLGSGENVDGVVVGTTLEEDAKTSAKILKGNAKGVYSVDVSNSSNTIEDWGKAFLSYNRGYMYVYAGVEWDQSPYPMNYIDSDHIYMTFPNNSAEPASTRGEVDTAMGALVIFIYLGGMDGGSASSASSSGSSDGKDVTWIGDSITIRAKNFDIIGEKLPQADIYAQEGKTFGEKSDESAYGGKGGTTILKEIVDSKKLRETLIFALGTNSPGTTHDDINKVIELAKSAKRIIFVTDYDSNDINTYASNNNAFKKASDENDKVLVADWKSVAEKNSATYMDDNVHPTKIGAEKWVETILSRISANGSNTTKQKDNCGCTKTAGIDANSWIDDSTAQKIVDYYKDSNNDSKYTVSGGTKWNCVSFSTFFVQMFTDIGGKAVANGGDKKGCIACKDGFKVVNELEKLGVEVGTEPKPYSVFSISQGHWGTGEAGHTGVVIRVEGEKITFMDASWGNEGYTGIREATLSDFKNDSYPNVYAYIGSHIDAEALASVTGKTVNTAATNGADGVAVSSATWENGWITSGLDGFYKDDKLQSNDSAHNGSYSTKSPKTGTTGANKITLHSTEGPLLDSMKASDLYNSLYNSTGKSYPPHFTIDMKRKKTYQHYTINKPSDAVGSHDEVAGVQIEIVGYSTSDKSSSEWYLLDSKNFGKDEWAYLAQLLAAISSETGIPLTTGVDWATPGRLSKDEYKNYEGVLGHTHVPDNKHTDPGNIWPMLSSELGNTSVATGECSGSNNSFTGEFLWYGQCDTRWKNKPYGNCSSGNSVCDSGCGPSSLAMMITALTHTEVHPDEVAAYGGSLGMHICDKGSSHELPLKVADHFNIEATDISSGISKDKVTQYLKDGYMIWTCGSGPNPFTSGGHCIGVRGITDDGQWLVADSNNWESLAGPGEDNTMNQQWDPDSIYPYMNNFKALKAK